MASLEHYLEDQLARGRAYFSREEAHATLGLSPDALKMALSRLSRKVRLVSPRHGFYLILRPEDRAIGAPDPARWIDPLMKYLKLDYRVSLLRAAALHGASHQAAMVFQVIVPRQLRNIEIGRHRVEYLYQQPAAFAQVNRAEWLGSLKSEAGFAKVAGVELTLLDDVRYFHNAGGLNGVAQIVKDIGAHAKPRTLAAAAEHYENSAARRLGFLLERMGHARQAQALRPIAHRAKTAALLDPSVKPLSSTLAKHAEKSPDWRLILNEQVEIDD